MFPFQHHLPLTQAKPHPIFPPYASFRLQMCLYFLAFMHVVPSLNFPPSFLCIAPAPILHNTQFQSQLPGKAFPACLLLSQSQQLLTTTTPKHTLICAGSTVWESCYPLAYCSIIGYSFLPGSCQTMGSSRAEICI